MKVEQPTSRIVCDSCGTSEAATEEAAVGSGWLIDYNSQPHVHICRACQEAVLRRA